MATSGILFYGDPHGEWQPLFQAVREHRPAAVVLLGDLDLERPFREQLAPMFHNGIPVRWIHGNHDFDKEEWFSRLFDDYPEGSIHGQRAAYDGIRVAGLGGVFKGSVWYPKDGTEKSRYPTRAKFLQSFKSGDRFRNGLPLSMRDIILPEDFVVLRRIRADILVTHEAPSWHKYGYGALDDLAKDMGAKLLVHGHQHESYDGRTRDGIWVRGLGKAEPWLLTKELFENPI